MNSESQTTITVPRELMQKLQAAINPLSGFLRRRTPKMERYLESIREELREILK